MVRLLVVDDHDLFRAGLASLLSTEAGIEVVGQASGGKMGVRLAAELRPDVILMDVRMPDISGPEATRQIVERDPGIRVLALTVSSDDADVSAVLQAGAVGFLAKDTPIDSLVVARERRRRMARRGSRREPPRSSSDGSAPRLPRLRRRRRRSSSSPSGRSTSCGSSPTGWRTRRSRRSSNISPRTAKNHVSNILAKLGLPSRVQAAVYAVRQGVS